MKKIITFFLLIVIISCNKSQGCDDTQKIREIETANIIGSFNYNKGSLPICITLKKLNIRTDLKAERNRNDSMVIVKLPPKEDLLSRNTELFIEKLLDSNFFNQSDSLNFVQQNYCLSHYSIPNEISEKVKTISLATLKNQKEKNEYIIMSIPIFSIDNKKAYIEIDTYAKDYKHGESFYLEKNGEKWKVIYIVNNWNQC